MWNYESHNFESIIFFISYQNGKFYKEVLGLSNDISSCSIGVDLGPSKHCLKVGSDIGSLAFNPSNGHNYIYSYGIQVHFIALFFKTFKSLQRA